MPHNQVRGQLVLAGVAAAGLALVFSFLSWGSAGAQTAAPTAASGPLAVTIAHTKDFSSGYTDTVTVTNKTGSAVNGWNVQFDLDPSMNIESATNVTFANTGNHYTLTNTSADATIANGASRTFQFSGHKGKAYHPPTHVTVTGGGPTTTTPPPTTTTTTPPTTTTAAPTTAVPRPGTSPANINEAKVVYYLALVDRQAPGATATNGTTVDSALLAQIHSMIAGGHEPDADGGLEMWAQAPTAQALLLLKNGPAWS